MMCNCTSENPYARSWLWIPGLRQAAHPQMRNCASGNDRSKRLLLVAALLAGEFDAGGAFFGLEAVRRAALAAGGLDAGIALLNDDSLARHGFADQALGLFAHRLLRHPHLPVMRTAAGAVL